MSTSLTRAELYQLVWSQPLRILSKRFGISDVALAKRCRSANIPLPGIGYWAKKEAGKPTSQPELPPRGFGQTDSLDIGRGGEWGGRAESDEDLLRTTPRPPEPFPDGFPEVMVRARQLVGTVRVSSSLAKPHPVVARLLRDDDIRREKQKASTYLSDYYAPFFESPFERRRLRFMNSLLHALARVGGKASVHGREGQELGVTIGNMHLGFKLAPLKQLSTNYPPKQLASNEKMKLELGWYEPPPEVKPLWADGEGQTLENQIEEIAASLVAYAEWAYRHGLQREYEYRVERKRELEERIRKQKEEEARRERERKEKAEADRRNKLLADAAAWRTASNVRGYVDAQLAIWSQAAEAKSPSSIRAWADWARSQADEIDPLRARPAL